MLYGIIECIVLYFYGSSLGKILDVYLSLRLALGIISILMCIAVWVSNFSFKAFWSHLTWHGALSASFCRCLLVCAQVITIICYFYGLIDVKTLAICFGIAWILAIVIALIIAYIVVNSFPYTLYITDNPTLLDERAV